MDFWTILGFINIIVALIFGVLFFKRKDVFGIFICAIVIIGQSLSTFAMIY